MIPVTPLPPPKTTRLPYLPGLDGLRALAVMAVLIYHSALGWLPGGFLGVDIFFAISGYLITSLLLAEWQRSGGIDLKAFWLRRARRLLPALFALLGTTLAFCVVFLPEEVAALRQDVLAALGYVSNWYLILDQKSYFETVNRPSLLRHLWSLAVEEQFYLLWPLAVTVALAVRRWPAQRLLLAVLAGAGASTLLMAALFDPSSDPSRVYYGTDTRAAGLLIGAALAFPPLAQAARRLPGRLADALAVAGLAVLAALCLVGGEYDPLLYRGGFALAALATTATIAGVVHPQGRLGPAFLGRRPLRWIGLRSYGIYLWHWPVYMVTRPQLDVSLTGLPLLAVQLAATALLAELSYRLVEMPVRSGALVESWRAIFQAQGRRRMWLGLRWVSAGSTVLAGCVAVGISVVSAQAPQPPSYLAVSVVDTVGAPPLTVSPQNALALGDVPLAPGPITSPAAAPAAEETPPPTPAAPPAATATPAGPTASPTAPPEPVFQPAATPTISDAMPDRPRRTTATATPAAGLRTLAPATLGRTPAQVGKVVAVGDSVMVGAAEALLQTIADIGVDAAAGRQPGQGVQLMRAYAAAGKLEGVILVHLGNNGVLMASHVDDIVQTAGPGRRVLFVNVKVPRQWEQPSNDALADGLRKYANVRVLDWRGESGKHPEWFWSDGIHLRAEGAQAYADLILKALQNWPASR